MFYNQVFCLWCWQICVCVDLFFSPYVSPQHRGPFLDDSPEYGLQGYQLHIDMHGGGTFYLCSTLYALFSSKGEIIVSEIDGL